MTQHPECCLTICVATFNRASFLGATLASIIPQLETGCEILVMDNASTDDTQRVVADCAARCSQLRYIRQDVNRGLDRNYDSAVQHAHGKYCWLMADDDLLKPGAVARVLDTLRLEPSLVIVNKEYRDFTMTKVVQSTALDFQSDRTYAPSEMDSLFMEVNQDLLMYVGATVIKREIWLGRLRERYYGSMFIHVGVVFQERLPAAAIVIAEPLVSYRLGNTHSYSQAVIEIVFKKWPEVVRSLAISDAARRSVPRGEPWANSAWLLLLRGWGFYSLAEYRQWIRPRLRSLREKIGPILVALLPAVLVNLLLLAYFSVRHNRGRWKQAMRHSPHNLRRWRELRYE